MGGLLGDLGVILGDLGGSSGHLGGSWECGGILGWGMLEGVFSREGFGRRVAVLLMGSEDSPLLVVYGLSLYVLSRHSCP